MIHKLILLAGFPALGLLAQAANDHSSSLDPWVTILQWGPAGVVLVLLGSGQLRFNREVKKVEQLYELERTARIKAEEDRASVNTKAANEFIPLLTEATHILADFRPRSADRAVATALAAIAEKLEEIDRK